MNYEEAIDKAFTFEDEATDENETVEEATESTDVEEQDSKEPDEEPEEEATTDDEGDAEESDNATQDEPEKEVEGEEKSTTDDEQNNSSNWYKNLPKEAKRAFRKKDREVKRLKKKEEESYERYSLTGHRVDPQEQQKQKYQEYEYQQQVQTFMGNVTQSLNEQFDTLPDDAKDVFMAKRDAFTLETGLNEKFKTLAVLAKNTRGMDALVTLMSDERQMDILADMDDDASSQYVSAILREIEYSGNLAVGGMNRKSATKSVSSPKVNSRVPAKTTKKTIDVTPNSDRKGSMNKGNKTINEYDKKDWAKEFGYI